MIRPKNYVFIRKQQRWASFGLDGDEELSASSPSVFRVRRVIGKIGLARTKRTVRAFYRLRAYDKGYISTVLINYLAVERIKSKHFTRMRIVNRHFGGNTFRAQTVTVCGYKAAYDSAWSATLMGFR